MESNYYYYMLGQKSKIINYVLLCSETLRVKVERLYFYSFLIKLKCLCVILINVINIIKLTFNTIRWSC